MIYIETGSTDVYFNFAAEYYFATERDPGDPTAFLFWRTTPTLMIGKYQNALEEIDLSYARQHGIHVVRRLSGGGTIYTDLGGWQYTFITRGDTSSIRFEEYLRPVLSALAELGVQAGFNGRNDLTIGGRKISGNAQYKLAGHTVHHGSLLLCTDIEEMVRSTSVDPEKISSKSIRSVRERVTNIADHLPGPISPEDFKTRMVRSILGDAPRIYMLTDADRARISTIAGERFASWEAIYGATPRFSIERSARLAGGKMTFSLDVRRGHIAQCAVSGDFFGTVEASAFDLALRDCPYRRDAVEDALTRAGLDGAIYRITAREMAAVIAPDA